MADITSPDEFRQRVISRRKFAFEIVPKAMIGAYFGLTSLGAAVRIGSKLIPMSRGPVPFREVQKGTTQKTESKKTVNIGEGILKDLGDGFANHMAVAKGSFAEATTYAKEIYRKQAVEALNFATRVRELLKDNKPRLANIAQFTNVGTEEPGVPSDVIRENPENWILLPNKKFVSGHFGPQEFINLKHSRLTRLNIAVPIAISLVESGSESNLYSRLIGVPEGKRRALIWDAFNGHKGRDAGRYLSGITNSQIFTYGTNSMGGILATETMENSTDMNDRLQVLLQPLILSLRCMRPSPRRETKIVDFEASYQNGEPNYPLISNWLKTEDWFKRFHETYKAIQEFCTKHPEYNWIVIESIV